MLDESKQVDIVREINGKLFGFSYKTSPKDSSINQLTMYQKIVEFLTRKS